jgi:hypothetical protein
MCFESRVPRLAEGRRWGGGARWVLLWGIGACCWSRCGTLLVLVYGDAQTKLRRGMHMWVAVSGWLVRNAWQYL